MTPLFSVIVPFRNAEATLGQTLDSLRAQTLTDWECCLVDDASHDASIAIAKDAARRDPRFRVFVEGKANRRGVGASRNIGISAAQGRFIAFLDADDLWLPTKLARQSETFDHGAEIVFSAYQRISRDGRALGVVQAPSRITYDDALAGNPIGCLTASYRRDQFPDARMPLRLMHEDYPFWLSLLKTGAVAVGLPDILAQYRVSPGSHSARKIKAALSVWDILRAEGLPPDRRLRGFAGYLMRSLRNRL